MKSLAVLLLAGSLTAAPLPRFEPPVPPRPWRPPDLTGKWGGAAYTIEQLGQAFRIRGDHWSAHGLIHTDGRILVWWYRECDDQSAVGVYRLVDGGLQGQWAYGGFDGEALPEGGTHFGDTLRRSD